jgi:ABC-type multidrug transport system fused ATPase/permease subunit
MTQQPQPQPQENPVIRAPSDPTAKLFRKRPFAIDHFEKSTGFHSGPNQIGRSYRRALWSFAASVIDTLIVVSIVCFFLVAFSLIVNVDMKTVLSFFNDSFIVFGTLVFVMFAMLYTTLLRSFLAYTIGEWACGLRLGQPKERYSQFYSVRVILRTLAVFFTGVIVLPALSLLSGYDMAGRLSGIYLFELPKR